MRREGREKQRVGPREVGLETVGKDIDRRSVGGEPQGSFLSHGLSVLIQVAAQ